MLTDNSFETALDHSRPDHIEIDHTVRAYLDQMAESISVSSSRSHKSGSPRWRRPLFLIPAIGVLALATTAGAVAYSFSKTDAAVIPINYTTASGQQITCGYGVSGSSQVAGVTTAALRKYVTSHDWTGTGQKVYRYAVAHPYVPTVAESQQLTQTQIDSFSFSLALAAVIGDEIPASVEPTGYLAGGESNCLGTLR